MKKKKKEKKLPNHTLLMIVSSEGCLGGLGRTAELSSVTLPSCDPGEVRIGPPHPL